MNKLRFLFFFLFLPILVIPLTSCDDNDDDDTVVAPSKTELLTTSQWTGFAIYVNGVDQTQVLLNMDEPLDIKTWILKFNKDGTYKIQGDWIEPSPFTGIWEFTSDQNSILFDKNIPEAKETIKVNKLTNTELYLDMVVEDENGTPITGEVRFKH